MQFKGIMNLAIFEIIIQIVQAKLLGNRLKTSQTFKKMNDIQYFKRNFFFLIFGKGKH